MSNGYSGEEVSVALQPLNCSFTLYRSLNDVLKKPKKSKPDPRQLTLVKRFYSDFYCSPIPQDFGQKTFQQCTTCGMLYTCGLEEREHYKFHTRSNEIPFPVSPWYTKDY